MIMIIATIYVFLSYVIFDQQLKITFRKSSAPPRLKKSTPPKNSKSASSPLFANIENFSAHPPSERWGGGEDTDITDKNA